MEIGETRERRQVLDVGQGIGEVWLPLHLSKSIWHQQITTLSEMVDNSDNQSVRA